MSSEMLRQRIIFLYKRGISINNIVWILQIRRDDVKRVIREAGLFNMKQIESDLNKKLEERGYLHGDEVPVKEPCKYCDTDADLCDGHDYIFEEAFNFGMLGDFHSNSYISTCNKYHTPEIQISYELSTSECDYIELGVRHIKISYCPFCGRELKEGRVLGGRDNEV